ncbi:MAG: hypothetical protein NTW13_04515, partial [Candidatus Omnitrophica bacterium]|nr:hypothetical protein [Candidatus Omnitrophota bacterium]
IKKSLIGFLILFGMAIYSSAYAEVTREGITDPEVRVGVDKATNQVKNVQMGRHGNFLTPNEISRDFGKGTGNVTLTQFQQSLARNPLQFTPSAVKVNNANGNLESMLNYMDQAKQYMANRNMTFTPPKTINFGDNGAGSYSNEDTWNINTAGGSDFGNIIISKTIQTSLCQNYPNLGYQATEAFSRYFLYDLTGRAPNQPNSTYNKNLNNYSGSDIQQGYADYNAGKITKAQLDKIMSNTKNNNEALTQAMLDINNSSFVWDALQRLQNTYNPDGQEIRDSFLKANPQNTSQIQKAFDDRGV